MADKGVVLDSSLTQFYQGVSAGGIEEGSEYNGTVQAALEFDFGKLAGWQFWSAEIKAENALWWAVAPRNRFDQSGQHGGHYSRR